MKDVGKLRAERAVKQSLDDLQESLLSVAALKSDAKIAAFFAELPTDEPGLSKSVDRLFAALTLPLQKGSAKYAKAVHSITNAQACVYHAIAYRDHAACQTSCPLLETFGIAEKMDDKDGPLATEERGILWSCLDELATLVFRARRADPPAVPTTDAIAADIQRRKATKARGPEPGEPVLASGAQGCLRSLCERRGASMPADAGEWPAALAAVDATAERCRTRDAALAQALQARCAFLGDAPFTEEDWEDLEKSVALATMQRAIPSDMLNNIEAYAHKLMAGMQDGTASLETLDIEQIGKQVLAGTSEADLNAFASQIDKIMPALGAMGANAPPGGKP